MPTDAGLAALLNRGQNNDNAILAENQPPLTYAGLRSQIAACGDQLQHIGIGPSDRVAIVLPNGPRMATAFVAVAANACAAPLNPAYRTDEFRFFLEDLDATALIIDPAEDSPAVEVARERGMHILALGPAPENSAAGAFALTEQHRAPPRPTPPAPIDASLILHTSGTTSRPKMVPLTAVNLSASANHIATTLQLAPADRCLNIMPLFHIHGLVGALLSTLYAGASIFCTPGFNALRFFGSLADAQPTWFTAVPTMHQAILARAARNESQARDAGLRFIRSSSASLPPQVLTGLEAAFGCPVIESYGMTEAAHQMASNQLPPGDRQAGAVGVAAGPEIAVLGGDNQPVQPGAVGEIVIRGPNVMTGYVNNPSANEGAFIDGWFRTGDQGVLDPAGMLRITGRLKEIINRGGEKISPREIDEVLLDHPAVTQAVAFAIPHKSLGEEVGAAVVLSDGDDVDEQALRDFVAGRLAGFKVPRTVHILDELPKGATGKVQRIGLAQKLGLAPQ